MAFFSNLPNVYIGVEESESLQFKLVKNIFRRVIVNEELEKFTTQFESYYIPDGKRPEELANDFYGDPELDWVILITNNITDVYNQWPLSTENLIRYSENKYENIDAIHHWETKKIEYAGAVFIKEGITVSEDFTVVLPDQTVLPKNDAIYSVSNFEYETYQNEKKRLIIIPDSTLLEFFEDEFPELVGYKNNREIDTSGNKKSIVSPAARLLSNKSKYRNLSVDINTFSNQTINSFNYGPGSTTVTVENGVAQIPDNLTTNSTLTTSGYLSGGVPYTGPFHYNPVTGEKMVGEAHTSAPHATIYTTLADAIIAAEAEAGITTTTSNTGSTSGGY